MVLLYTQKCEMSTVNFTFDVLHLILSSITGVRETPNRCSIRPVFNSSSGVPLCMILTVFHEKQAVTELEREGELVQDDADGFVLRFELREERHEFEFMVRIKVSSGLIEQDDVGVLR